MYAESLALLAAMSFGLSAIALKKGYRHSTPLASNLIMAAVNVFVMWTVSAFFVPARLFWSSAALFFVAGGLLGPGVARTLRHVSVDRLGPSKAYTIIGSSPLFASVFAVLFLGEEWTLPLFAGTVLVVAGIALLSGAWKDGKDGKKYLILPVAAAVIYGFVTVVQKTGLSLMPNSLVGTTTAVTSAFLGIAAFSMATGRMRNMKVGKAWPLFIAAGVLSSAGLLMNFEALRSSNVTVVSPLIGTQPLFVALFSFLFLKDLEKLTWKVAAGAMLVVAGAAIVTAF